jgi:hypothetical protein
MLFNLRYFDHNGIETTNFVIGGNRTNTMRVYVDSTGHSTDMVNNVAWDLTMLTNYADFTGANFPITNDFFEEYAMKSPGIGNQIDNSPEYIPLKIRLRDNSRTTMDNNVAPTNRNRCVGEFYWIAKKVGNQKILFNDYAVPNIRGPPLLTDYGVTEDRPAINITLPEPATAAEAAAILGLIYGRKKKEKVDLKKITYKK